MTKMQHWLQSLTLIKKKSVCYAAVAVDYKPNPYPMNSGLDWSKGSRSNATVPGEDDRRIRVRTFQIGSHGTCKNIVILDPHREWSLHANKVEIKEDAISHNHKAEKKFLHSQYLLSRECAKAAFSISCRLNINITCTGPQICLRDIFQCSSLYMYVLMIRILLMKKIFTCRIYLWSLKCNSLVYRDVWCIKSL